MPAPLRTILFAFLLLLPVATFAQSHIRTEHVQFAPGATSATVEDSVKGYKVVDYVLRAREGQSMRVSMSTDNGANYFNILAPGEDSVAMFNGSVGENRYEGTLPKTGDYRIRVYLMRSAARRNESGNFRLEMSIDGSDSYTARSGDALVPGTDYHATGEIPCAMHRGQPMGSCKFGVRRQGGGTAVMTVTRPDSSTLFVVFENGELISAGGDESFNGSQDGAEFVTSREADLTFLAIGEERYEIPEIVFYGD